VRYNAQHIKSDLLLHRRISALYGARRPFANIAIGQSSIIGDRIGLKLFDYHVTESGLPQI